ncbi:MAG: class I SAM-dependent methyltransferase, partial [Candidatus Sericytochromatia bacterium]
QVDADEPNDRMRELGQIQTREYDNVNWFEGTGEATGRPASQYQLVTFGSSFNVTDRLSALAETRRILIPGGWFACMWNHRNLEDPIQKEIEAVILKSIPDYAYGTRREDQYDFLTESGYFEAVFSLEGQVIHRQSREACLTAWRSHATLQRQAGDAFERVIDDIDNHLHSAGILELEIPYTTRIWYARLKS